MAAPSKSSRTDPASKVVTCPACGGDSLYTPQNLYRPLCSERCKQIDLGAWANEDFRMPTDTPSDDPPVGDTRLQ